MVNNPRRRVTENMPLSNVDRRRRMGIVICIYALNENLRIRFWNIPCWFLKHIRVTGVQDWCAKCETSRPGEIRSPKPNSIMTLKMNDYLLEEVVTVGSTVPFLSEVDVAMLKTFRAVAIGWTISLNHETIVRN